MKTEIKLDETSLPEDGQLCEFDTHDFEEIIGFYIKEEHAFYPINDDPKSLITAFDVNFWEPVEISWQKKVCLEPKEGIFKVIGFDKFDNMYEAGGIYSCGELVEVKDIEFIKKVKRKIGRPDVAKNIVWR